jgi:hypothetical protein
MHLIRKRKSTRESYTEGGIVNLTTQEQLLLTLGSLQMLPCPYVYTESGARRGALPSSHTMIPLGFVCVCVMLGLNLEPCAC